ncbi:hypothetical protein DL771_002995 [Monosporascus sp. 5C6A]|nr:hypothetical protein DL771_002995 [Monosporascus sp. 5C6A]
MGALKLVTPMAGLMQCYNCPGYENQDSLSQDQIDGMIQGGAEHYKGNMANWGESDQPSTIRPALRE